MTLRPGAASWSLGNLSSRSLSRCSHRTSSSPSSSLCPSPRRRSGSGRSSARRCWPPGWRLLSAVAVGEAHRLVIRLGPHWPAAAVIAASRSSRCKAGGAPWRLRVSDADGGGAGVRPIQTALPATLEILTRTRRRRCSHTWAPTAARRRGRHGIWLMQSACHAGPLAAVASGHLGRRAGRGILLGCARLQATGSRSPRRAGGQVRRHLRAYRGRDPGRPAPGAFSVCAADPPACRTSQQPAALPAIHGRTGRHPRQETRTGPDPDPRATATRW